MIDNIIHAIPALKRLESRRLAMKKSTEEDNIEDLQLEGELPSDIDPRMKLSPCDFMCEDCGLCNSNLWLNLSDGKILCGRKYREGEDLMRPLTISCPQLIR